MKVQIIIQANLSCFSLLPEIRNRRPHTLSGYYILMKSCPPRRAIITRPTRKSGSQVQDIETIFILEKKKKEEINWNCSTIVIFFGTAEREAVGESERIK